TIATASLTGRAHNHTDFDLPLAGILHTDCPHFYRHAVPHETEQDFAVRCAMNLEQLIIKEGPETIAAMIV
ncbi:MAG TPA: aspartate aminotransferase family protein, partial [Alphaproteobacteria bacterium]|nr:aspartate aminotransferase family protein [Alphaproteobacteria bacterium]